MGDPFIFDVLFLFLAVSILQPRNGNVFYQTLSIQERQNWSGKFHCSALLLLRNASFMKFCLSYQEDAMISLIGLD